MLACTRAMRRAVNTGRWAQRRASEPAGLGDAARVLELPALGPHSEHHWALRVHALSSTGDLNETDCDRQTCECDKSVVLCLQSHTYNEKYRNYLNIYCQGITPNCSIYEQPHIHEQPQVNTTCRLTTLPPPAPR